MADQLKNMISMVGVDENKTPFMQNSTGRILNAHAVMYIMKGSGYFEDEFTPRRKINAGTAFFLYPNRWHCFDPNSTWTEGWVVFNGPEVEKQFGQLIPTDESCHEIGISESLAETYEELCDLWYNKPNFGYNEYSNYLLHKILVEIWLKTNDISFKRKDNAIYRVRKAMLLSIHQGEFDVERFAKKEKVSYDSLRKKFKQETGLSPHQYFLLIKLNRAKALLLRQNITVKQIASELGFEDPYYFSRLFTKKEGLSPDSYRKKKLTSILHANKFLDSNP